MASDNQGTLRHVEVYDLATGESSGERLELSADGVLMASFVGDEFITTLSVGRDYDAETNLYYNRARWFDPVIARFISEDPIGFAGGDTNLYVYCGNSSPAYPAGPGEWGKCAPPQRVTPLRIFIL